MVGPGVAARRAGPAGENLRGRELLLGEPVGTGDEERGVALKNAATLLEDRRRRDVSGELASVVVIRQYMSC